MSGILISGILISGILISGILISGILISGILISWILISRILISRILISRILISAGILISGILISWILISGILISGILISGILISGISTPGILISGILISGILISGILISGILISRILNLGPWILNLKLYHPQDMTLSNLMGKLESVQYSAALAVTGAWRGTSQEKLYAELGSESLNFRRWSRCLTLFFKIVNNLTPLYSKEPIPLLHRSNYSLRNQDVIGRIGARTEKFQPSFYPHCLAEWNELDRELRHGLSVAVFKKKLLSIIRPPAKSVFGIYDPIGLSYLTQIRVGLSKLNLHKFLHIILGIL